jgi:anti-sigma B factor antagonist
MVMTLDGRLDTATAPLLERKIKQWGDEITELILDFENLTYISSMGLRVLLQTQKVMNAQDRKLIIRNMKDSVREVFEMTGFINLMVQEEKFVVIRKDEPNQIILFLNGQMDSDNVPALAQELSQIKAANLMKDDIIVLVLDAKKLKFISEGASRLLRRAIEDSYWEKRKLVIQHVAMELRHVFEDGGMKELLEQELPRQELPRQELPEQELPRQELPEQA